MDEKHTSRKKGNPIIIIKVLGTEFEIVVSELIMKRDIKLLEKISKKSLKF